MRRPSVAGPERLSEVVVNRRALIANSGLSLGGAALSCLIGERRSAAEETSPVSNGQHASLPHFAAKAKRVIYLFMHGGPSQMDLFDYKPELVHWFGKQLPDSVRQGQRLTGMTSHQKNGLPVAPSLFQFSQHGESGAWVSELMPHFSTVVDDVCFIRSMQTEAINHDPGVSLMQTGNQQPGRPSFGAWISYGLGSENRELPTFVVLISDGSAARPADPLQTRLWGSAFLPSNHQGVQFRSSGDPVLYLSNPPGIDAIARRQILDGLGALNQRRLETVGDPEIETRIRQFEMAFRMQRSVPSLTDLSTEPESTFRLYGEEARRPGSFAANCLLARRMAERGVRFIQLYHRGWDQHYNLPADLRLQCRDIDQPCAALIADLKQRGLLKDTLVIWGGEFGRTIYSQGRLEHNNYGRDHHGRCFTMWLAGGGIRPGLVYGATDEFSYNITEKPVHVHQLNATLLHCLGIDHLRLTFKHQGLDMRLTGIDHRGPVKEILL